MALVYSTESGRLGKTKPGKKSKSSNRPDAPNDGIVRIRRETKGRKGSGVSIIEGLTLGDKDLKALAKKIKQKCSSGGAIKDGVIEIQGDHRELIKTLLEKEGYTAKLAGG